VWLDANAESKRGERWHPHECVGSRGGVVTLLLMLAGSGWLGLLLMLGTYFIELTAMSSTRCEGCMERHGVCCGSVLVKERCSTE
jgi:hypothetical protein